MKILIINDSNQLSGLFIKKYFYELFYVKAWLFNIRDNSIPTTSELPVVSLMDINEPGINRITIDTDEIHAEIPRLNIGVEILNDYDYIYCYDCCPSIDTVLTSPESARFMVISNQPDTFPDFDIEGSIPLNIELFITKNMNIKLLFDNVIEQVYGLSFEPINRYHNETMMFVKNFYNVYSNLYADFRDNNFTDAGFKFDKLSMYGYVMRTILLLNDIKSKINLISTFNNQSTSINHNFIINNTDINFKIQNLITKQFNYVDDEDDDRSLKIHFINEKHQISYDFTVMSKIIRDKYTTPTIPSINNDYICYYSILNDDVAGTTTINMKFIPLIIDRHITNTLENDKRNYLISALDEVTDGEFSDIIEIDSQLTYGNTIEITPTTTSTLMVWFDFITNDEYRA